MREIPVEYLREALSYDPLTGKMWWKTRPRSHFKSEQGWCTFNAKFSGRVAGTIHFDGYMVVNIRIDGVKRSLSVHCVAWILTIGVWPSEEIDHRGDSQ